ncbi:MAG: hypothetical protein M9894_25045 [Planctomycetes bacterium]|nr:hypothetical protein [Planctomycetota bacterium]
MLAHDEMAAGFVEHARRAPGADALPDDRWEALREDAAALGLFGLLAALAEPAPTIDPAVRGELVEPLDRDLRDALGEPADEAGDAAARLPARLERFAKAKGERGPDLVARGTARVVHEVYALAQHRLAHEDALVAADILAWGGPGQDAREAAKRLTRLGRQASRVVLGHLTEQLALVHALGQEEQVAWTEVDARLHEFAPRVFAQRLPSMMRLMVRDDPRLRFAFVLWGRLRGVVLPRAGVQAIGDHVVPEKPMTLVQALEERRDARAVLRRADAEWPVARALERVFLGRVLPAPPARPASS